MSPLTPPTAAITRDFTATTFVVAHDQTLLLLHRKLGKWFPPGGHIEPNELPDQAALREVREECGLVAELLAPGRPIGAIRMLPQPFCILLEDIGPGHQHIDLIYFATGAPAAPRPKVDWFALDQLEPLCLTEEVLAWCRLAVESASL